MEFRLAGLVEDSIVDGPGIRLAVFFQGCTLGCPGCHNPGAQALDGGRLVSTEEVLKTLRENPLESGITLTGGEPFLQPSAAEALAAGARALGRHVLAFSGYRFEELLKDPSARKALTQIDLLIDGPFLLEERSLELRFKGSRNQRAIDVQASLKCGQTLLKTL
ncbi:MAG: radical SAM protein [Christensenellaceae bacterium]|jgi:anaerobic ribonucleoside-triphosphate reductase activating protein|nr:radical SAM protein [Christensenellaceae bacterium]